MAETDDNPTEILLSRARLYVARHTDSTPAAERLILDELADGRLRWKHRHDRIAGEPDLQTQCRLGVQLAAMKGLSSEIPLVVWGSQAIRKCFWRRPESGEALEVHWEQSRAVRLSPPLILAPDPDQPYPVRFPNYPTMRVEIDIIRLFRTELDEMLRQVGLMTRPAAPPPPPPPPPPPTSSDLPRPTQEGTERWVYDEMDRDRPRRGDRKYVDRLWRRRLDKGIEKGTIKNYVGKYRKQFEIT